MLSLSSAVEAPGRMGLHRLAQAHAAGMRAYGYPNFVASRMFDGALPAS
jgi:hypothetical protein